MKHIMQKKLVRAWLVKFQKKREWYIGYKSQINSIQLEIRHCFVSWFNNKNLTRIVRLCNKLPIVIGNVSHLLYLNPHYMHFLEEDRFRHKWQCREKCGLWQTWHYVGTDAQMVPLTLKFLKKLCKVQYALSAVHRVMLIIHQILSRI